MQTITPNFIIEAAVPAYKRKGSSVTRYYRCSSGPKKGKLSSDPGKCGERPNPKRVRHGRKVARTRGAIRVRKTAVTKLQHLSKKITSLNKNLSHRISPTNNINKVNTTESFLEFITSTPKVFFTEEHELSDFVYDCFEYDYIELSSKIDYIISDIPNIIDVDLFVEGDDIIFSIHTDDHITGYIINE